MTTRTVVANWPNWGPDQPSQPPTALPWPLPQPQSAPIWEGNLTLPVHKSCTGPLVK